MFYFNHHKNTVSTYERNDTSLPEALLLASAYQYAWNLKHWAQWQLHILHQTVFFRNGTYNLQRTLKDELSDELKWNLL